MSEEELYPRSVYAFVSSKLQYADNRYRIATTQRDELFDVYRHSDPDCVSLEQFRKTLRLVVDLESLYLRMVYTMMVAQYVAINHPTKTPTDPVFPEKPSDTEQEPNKDV